VAQPNIQTHTNTYLSVKQSLGKK